MDFLTFYIQTKYNYTMEWLLIKAINFAKYKHRYQIRKYSTDLYYYTHCLEVMAMVSRSPSCTLIMKVVAILHDTLEDTDTTIEELEIMFGKEIARMVKGLTDISKPTDGNRLVRKAMDRQHLSEQDADTQTVKVADMMANAKDIMIKDAEKFGPVFIAEAKLLSQVLTKACPVLKKELDDFLSEY